ncbi:MAG: TlyA family RNA methyltransferase [Actinomycetota bacterium]|nr:TlyA family RNA methyltransferase [Actinomycetota bacterium]MDH5277419.1 TlyA family RNA methyltransferase [Actinomycetota bacterium]
MARRRLDAELVRRGLARSRHQAQELVASGRVRVSGLPAAKPATQVDPAVAIVVDTADVSAFVSRGAHKLVGAMAVFRPAGLVVAGRRCLDAGASTGGFTQVLLAEGAASVLAVDVGYGQLAWSLRSDPRVTALDRTNVRTLRPEQVGEPAELVVADLSFISLRLVMPALASVAVPDADFVLMVKPQFEVGRERLGPGGVVKDPSLRAESVRRIAERAAELGLGVRGVTASPLPGPAGNVEYFVWLQAGAPAPDPEAIARAVSEGPE